MKRTSLIRAIILIPVLSIFYRYFVIPNHPFPGPPPDAVQSIEPADVEDPNRRAYFTDYTRDQVVAHYAAQLSYLPTIRLNYPPEDAQTIIRDQTRTWYLEELVHPFRSSVYINGFIAQKPKDAIVVNGKTYVEKITIKYVPSNIFARLLVGTAALAISYLFIIECKKSLKYLLS